VIDPFATLGLERTYRLDLRAAEKTHRELSRALHPDKYVSAGASERREALTRAVEVNEAWRVVRDPIQRAEALFTLAGVQVGDTHEPKPASSLLMDMMEQRETLAEAKAKKSVAAVQALVTEMTSREAAVQGSLATAFDDAHGAREKLEPLVAKLGELRYYRRFLEEASASLESLHDLGISS
jgi:molecular chaperone HscB